MKKLIAVILVILMSLCLPVFAQPAAVNDQAGALSPGLVSEINQLSILLHQYLGIKLNILTRHFLGGEDVQVYTERQAALNNQPDEILMTIIIGEERYALSLGEKAGQLISKDMADNLLSRHFRDAFLTQRAYDKALAVFLLSLSEQLQVTSSVNLPPNELLYTYAGQENAAAPSPTKAPKKDSSWLGSIFADPDKVQEGARQYDQDAQQAAEGKGGGLSLFQIALIGFVLYKIFGKKRAGKKGCGPLGWIFGTWGLSKFFGWRK